MTSQIPINFDPFSSPKQVKDVKSKRPVPILPDNVNASCFTKRSPESFQSFLSSPACIDPVPDIFSKLPKILSGYLCNPLHLTLYHQVGMVLSKDPAIRMKAVIALGKMGAKARDVLPLLVMALIDKNADVRERVSDAINMIDPRISTMLNELHSSFTRILSEKDGKKRDYLIKNFPLWNEMATLMLAACLADDSQRIRDLASSLLSRSDIIPSNFAIVYAILSPTHRTKLLNILNRRKTRPDDYFILAIKSDNPIIRLIAMNAVLQMSNIEPAVAIVAFKRSNDEMFRQILVGQLFQKGIYVAYSNLTHLIKKPEFRSSAIKTVAALGEKSIPFFKWLLLAFGTDKGLMTEVTAELAKMGAKAAPVLFQTLFHSDENIRRLAMHALLRYPSQNKRYLIRALISSDWLIRQRFAIALAKLNEAILPSLLLDLSKLDRLMQVISFDIFGLMRTGDGWLGPAVIARARTKTFSFSSFMRRRSMDFLLKRYFKRTDVMALMLASLDSNCRQRAADALVKNGRKSLPDLTYAVAMMNTVARQAALKILFEHHGRATVASILYNAAMYGKKANRRCAILALKNFGKEALLFFTGLIARSKDAFVRRQAIHSLTLMGEQANFPLLYAMMDANNLNRLMAQQGLENRGVDVLKRLLTFLAHMPILEKRSIAHRLLRVLTEMFRKQVANSVVSLTATETDVRKAAVAKLVEITKSIIDVLKSDLLKLDDKNILVFLLANIRYLIINSIPSLKFMVNRDSNLPVRSAARDALKNMVGLLYFQLTSIEKLKGQTAVERMAIDTMERMTILGDMIFPVIMRVLNRDDEDPAKGLVIELLGRIGKSAYPILMNVVKLYSPIGRRAAKAIAGLNAPVLALLDRDLKSKDYQIRIKAALVMAYVNPKRALAILKIMIKDSDGRVSRAAVAILRGMDAAKRGPGLIAALGHPDKTVRDEALKALKAMGKMIIFVLPHLGKFVSEYDGKDTDLMSEIFDALGSETSHSAFKTFFMKMMVSKSFVFRYYGYCGLVANRQLWSLTIEEKREILKTLIRIGDAHLLAYIYVKHFWRQPRFWRFKPHQLVDLFLKVINDKIEEKRAHWKNDIVKALTMFPKKYYPRIIPVLINFFVQYRTGRDKVSHYFKKCAQTKQYNDIINQTLISVLHNTLSNNKLENLLTLIWELNWRAIRTVPYLQQISRTHKSASIRKNAADIVKLILEKNSRQLQRLNKTTSTTKKIPKT